MSCTILLIPSPRAVYPSTSIFLAPDLPSRPPTTAQMAITMAEAQQKSTFPPTLDSPTNLIYHTLYVPDPHDRARRQASLTRPCTRKMKLIKFTAGGNKPRSQRLPRLGPHSRPRSPRSLLRYPICPSLPCLPKTHISLIQTPADPTVLELPSTDTIVQVLTCCPLYLTKPTNLASWWILTQIPRLVRNLFREREHRLIFVRFVMQISKT